MLDNVVPIGPAITLSAPPPLQSSVSTASNSPAAVKLRKAAGEFESMLLESLWKSMKETFKDSDDPDSDPILESFDDWGIQGMASAVGDAGGLGIKNMIIKYLEPRLSGPADNAPSGATPSKVASSNVAR
jgi:Rod binding domain-containing protein